MLSRFLKVAIATPNILNKVYNGEFLPECDVAIATFKNLLNIAVLEERLNKTDIEKAD